VHHLPVTRHLLVDDYLQIGQTGAIVNLKERKGFGVSPGSNPTCDLNVRLGAGRKGVFDKRDHKTGTVSLGIVCSLCFFMKIDSFDAPV
jgi:hypothetical protein